MALAMVPSLAAATPLGQAGVEAAIKAWLDLAAAQPEQPETGPP